MRKILLFMLLFILPAVSTFSQEIRMLYMAQAGYQPSDILKRAKSFYERSGVRVNLSFVEYEDQYNLILESSHKEGADYDIILVDLIRTADFAEGKIIDPIPPSIEREVREGIIPEIYGAFEYEERIWAVPFLANFQLLYANTELLHRAGFSELPATLEEMVEMARAAKSKGIIRYPLFDSLNRQEVLVCEFVWLVGAFGGDLSGPRGSIDLNTPACRRALGFMVELLEKGLMNPYSLSSEEVFAAEVFLAGDCLFTTSWTFLSGLIREKPQSVARNSSAGLIPVSAGTRQGGRITSTVSGFQGLSVTRNSKNKDLAWEFIHYLSSPEFQRQHLEEMPVWRDVWTEEGTIEKDPEIALKKQQILAVHNRPIHPQYRKISRVMQEWIHAALRREATAERALKQAQAEIEGILGE